MKHRVSDKYYWEFNGIPIEGIVEYVGAHGIIASRYAHRRCKEIRQGDWVDLSEWRAANGYHGEGYTYYKDFGRVNSNYGHPEDLIHVCMNAGSCYLGPSADMKRAYVSMSGGPFETFWPEDLEPTMELREGRYWNFRMGWAEGNNSEHYLIKRPVFKLNPDARCFWKEIDAMEREFGDSWYDFSVEDRHRMMNERFSVRDVQVSWGENVTE